MAAQMIECYQLCCHFAGPQKRGADETALCQCEKFSPHFKIRTAHSDAFSFIMAKGQMIKISTCKCETFLPYDVEMFLPF